MPSLPPTRSTTPTPQSQSRRGSVGSRNSSSNPVPRLKLLLMISFITLHALNLLNTLSPANAHLRWLQAPPIPDSGSSSSMGEVGVLENGFSTHNGEDDVSDEKWKDDDMEVDNKLNFLTYMLICDIRNFLTSLRRTSVPRLLLLFRYIRLYRSTSHKSIRPRLLRIRDNIPLLHPPPTRRIMLLNLYLSACQRSPSLAFLVIHYSVNGWSWLSRSVSV